MAIRELHCSYRNCLHKGNDPKCTLWIWSRWKIPARSFHYGQWKKLNHIGSSVWRETGRECTHSSGALTINRGSSLTWVHQEWKVFESGWVWDGASNSSPYNSLTVPPGGQSQICSSCFRAGLQKYYNERRKRCNRARQACFFTNTKFSGPFQWAFSEDENLT